MHLGSFELIATRDAQITRKKAFYDAACEDADFIPTMIMYCGAVLGYYESPESTPCNGAIGAATTGVSFALV